jgi:glycosyltransferase involved in cell wall biosynthesis
MRIAYVCADPGVPVFGRKGCSIHVQELIRAFLRRGAQVDLFAANHAGAPPPGLENVRLHRLPALPKGDPAARERGGLRANQSLRTALAAAGTFDLIYERYALWSFAAQEYAQSTGSPGLLEVNAPLIGEQQLYRGLVDLAGAARTTARCMRAATAVAAVSEEVADYAAGFGVARERVHVLPNGVDPARFPPGRPAALPAPDGVFTVGFVGTLKPWHGLPALIAACDKLARSQVPLRLLIVGDGPERAALEADLAARGCCDIAYCTGAVAPEQIAGLLASMDVAVAPYPQLDQFYFSPLKLFEYMAAGLPVVASRVGQVERVIRHGVTGLLCPPGDAEALALALGRLWSDPALRARLGRAAREHVCRNHTWDAVAERVLALAAPTPRQPQTRTRPTAARSRI